MSKLANRLLTFFVGVPLIVSFTFMSVCKFLPLQALVYLFSGLVTMEFSNMLSKKMAVQNKYFVLGLCYTILFATSLQNYINFDSEIVTLSIFLSLFASFLLEIFSKKNAEENFSSSIERVCSTLLTMLYAGYFFSFIIKMTSPNWFHNNPLLNKPIVNSLYLALYLVIVFGTDSLAWFFGMLFGKKNRGLIKASPNKSIAGFVGGVFGTIIVVFIITRFIPLFNQYFSHISNFEIFFITFITSLFAIIGDLIESVFKRSANIKDSGNLIPGRGGILDSVDSMLLAAPVFYLLVKIF